MNQLIPAAQAEQINKHHRQAGEHAQEAIEHARQAGELLLEVKAQLPHGQFLPWLEQNSEVGTRQAQRYMRLAQEWPEIEANTTRETHLSINEAMQLLVQAREPDSPTPIYDKMVDAMEKLYVEAMDRASIPLGEIEDWDSELHYWLTLANGMPEFDKHLIAIRLRAEHGAKKLMSEAAT